MHARHGLALVALSVLFGASCAPSTSTDGEENGADHANDWEKAYEAAVSDPTCSGIVVPDKANFGHKIALTFDDGPNLETTPKVLEVLKKHGAHAAFMLNGMRVTTDAHKKLLKEMKAAGHILANHTQHHLNAVTLSSDKLHSEIEGTDKILFDLDLSPKYFRFPFGSSNCDTAKLARSYGYTITGWHVDSADWCFAADGGTCKKSTFKYVPDQYRNDMGAYVLSQIAQTKGGIVLFHDIHGNTANHLDAILASLEEEGYTWTTIDDLSTFPKLNGAAAAPPAAWIGSACTKDGDCSFDKTGFCLRGAEGAASGVCSVPCEGYCADKDGYASTFCATIDGATPSGACAQKVAAENGECAKLAGTHAVSVDRFVGNSTAKPATADVCLPK
jgi:peptidoglycan/xylan/chitin deacetylase (PgdA/CDA1 family)